MSCLHVILDVKLLGGILSDKQKCPTLMPINESQGRFEAPGERGVGTTWFASFISI